MQMPRVLHEQMISKAKVRREHSHTNGSDHDDHGLDVSEPLMDPSILCPPFCSNRLSSIGFLLH